MDHQGGPLLGDTEFTTARLIQAYNTDLANGLGNLTNRTVTLLHRYYDGRLNLNDGPVTGPAWDSTDLDTACAVLPSKIDAALQRADFRSATAHLVATVDIANQLLNAAEPWKVIRNPDGDPGRIQHLLSRVVQACRMIATEITPFCPDGAARLASRLGDSDRVASPEPVFSRLTYLE